MRINDQPLHFPFVPFEQRVKGLRFISKHASADEFELALITLMLDGMLDQEKCDYLLKLYTKIMTT